MANISINLQKELGRIKPLHGVGQAPFYGTDFRMFRYLTEAGIPYSRLHDVGGAFGGFLWADVPNIFRDFNADPYQESSYDFAFTDRLITALVDAGVEPYYRLGVTIENYAKIKAYRIYPPADFHKWAVICEHIIRHYTEGWANGFHYQITYWEIWNEPENMSDPKENQMWTGTKEEYYELYEIASKHLKSRFPHLKIGGYASTGFRYLNEDIPESAKNKEEAYRSRSEYFRTFFDGFLNHIKKNQCPLDFFSWHSYDSIEKTQRYARYVRARLDETGYTNTETSLNEWNVEHEMCGTPRHAALTAGMMLAMQDEAVETACFYDARLGLTSYAGLFHPMKRIPYPAYYAFVAFDRLYKLGYEVQTISDTDGIFAVTAKRDKNATLVIANTLDTDVPLLVEVNGSIHDCRITAHEMNDESCTLPQILPKESILTVNITLQ